MATFFKAGVNVGSVKLADYVLTPAYKGNPTVPFAGQNNTQNYAFFNFVIPDGYDRVDLVQNNGGGFENDNQTIGTIRAVAVATLAASAINFGTVRQGTAVTRTLGISNTSTGAMADSLVITLGALPTGTTGSSPTSVAQGQTGNASLTLNTNTAGLVTSSVSLGFASHSNGNADLSLAPQSVNITGTVTELANASLFKAGGEGNLSGSDSVYSLDLGTFAYGRSSAVTSLGALNAIVASAFSETLGIFAIDGSNNGFTFNGANFSGLAGGATSATGSISFERGTLPVGIYSATFYLQAFSRFAGLPDQALTRLTFNVNANISDATAVPEPAIWMQVITGFGLLGTAVRRRRHALALAAACQ